MPITILFLFGAVSANSNKVIVSPEAIFYETCLNTTNLYSSLEKLNQIVKTIDRFSQSLKGSSQFFSAYAATFSKSLDMSIKDSTFKIEQLTGYHHARNKRSPFNFVGEAGRYLFGFVSQSQYLNLKKNLKAEASILHEQNNQMIKDISQNRQSINKAITAIGKILEKITDYDKKWYLVEQMLALTIQASVSLQSVENIVSVLTQIRSDADKHLPSRFVMSPQLLSQLLLEINDDHQGIFPVFNSLEVDNYYRLAISTTSHVDKKLCQIVKIPLLSNENKFSVSHLDCPAGSICLSNPRGTTMLYLSDFLACNSLHYNDIPTICMSRPCISSKHTILCTMLNETTAVVATSKSFDLTISCQSSKSIIKIQGIFLLYIPTDCSTVSQLVTIHKIVTNRRTVQLPIIALNIPFSVTNGILNINSTLSHTQIFDNPHLKELILPKILPKFRHDHMAWHGQLSIGGTVSAAIAVCATVLIGVVVYCKIKKHGNRIAALNVIHKERTGEGDDASSSVNDTKSEKNDRFALNTGALNET